MAVDKPKWNGDFEAARRIAEALDPSHDIPDFLLEKIAEALAEAFHDGVLAERNANENPETKRVILTKLLHSHGIGIGTLDEAKSRTTAIASGEIKPTLDEPKLWFSSIDVFIRWVKIKAVPSEKED